MAERVGFLICVLVAPESGFGVFALYRLPRSPLPSSAARPRRSVALNLAEVMHQTVEQPLGIDLGFASQRKAIEALGRTQVREHGLDGGQAALVDLFAFERVDLALHPGGEGLARVRRAPAEEYHLAYPGLLRMAQTLCAQAAG